MKRYILILFSFLLAMPGFSQENTERETPIDLLPESLDANVDSLLHSWHVQYFTQAEDFCHDDEEDVIIPDSVYALRLTRLPCVIPMQYNDVVRQCIDLYTVRKRNLVRYILGMADHYFPIIEQILDEYDMPLELKYLAIVESALNPKAQSHAGAYGLWQFMLPTAKSYGLEINSLVDERLDVVKATRAACQYFKDMYAIYGDWNLVMASYNCGPGNVNKAIRRSGGKTNFWEIYPYLPRETRMYVPLFIAANYMMNYHCEHNLCPIRTNLPLATDTVMITNVLHLQQVAEATKLDIEQLRALNPQYKRDIIPGNTKPSVLKLPAATAYAFVDHGDTLYTSQRLGELLAGCTALTPVESRPSSPGRKECITHVVESGENIHTLSNRYGVSTQEIRKWNGLRSNQLKRGSKLRLYIDNGGVTYMATKADEGAIDSENLTAETKEKPVLEKQAKAPKKFITYKVKNGDSLYSISLKFPGVTSSVLQKTNGLKGTGIFPGQVLKIPNV